jgi:tellurite resistance protein TerC
VIVKFKYLKQALALVLIFIGSKIFVADLMGWDKFPASISLAVTLALISGGVLYSLVRVRQEKEA